MLRLRSLLQPSSQLQTPTTLVLELPLCPLSGRLERTMRP